MEFDTRFYSVPVARLEGKAIGIEDIAHMAGLAGNAGWVTSLATIVLPDGDVKVLEPQAMRITLDRMPINGEFVLGIDLEVDLRDGRE